MKYVLSIFVFLLSASLLPVEVLAQTATTTKCIQLKQVVQLNSKDSQVKGEVTVVQNFLIQKGFLSGKASGTFGQASVTALKRYQVKSRIADIGITDERTRAKILNDTCTKEQIAAIQKEIIRIARGIPEVSTSTKKQTASKALEQVTVTTVTTSIKDSSGKVIGATSTNTLSGALQSNMKLISSATTQVQQRIDTMLKKMEGFEILKPQGDSVFQAGKKATISWKAPGFSATDNMRIVLLNDTAIDVRKFNVDVIDGGIHIDLTEVGDSIVPLTAAASDLPRSFSNKGTYTWNVPSSLPFSEGYRIYIGPVDNLAHGKYSEPFTILSILKIPYITGITATSISNGQYTVRIKGIHFDDIQDVNFMQQGRSVGMVSSARIRQISEDEIQFILNIGELRSVSNIKTYHIVVRNSIGSSVAKSIEI